MEKMFKDSPGAQPQKRVLELNPKHPVVERLKSLHESDPKSGRLADYAYLLYGQGALTEGSSLPDPARYARLVAELMV